ncbi:hypothetical protein D3C76_1522470 [compost metagenome]
MLLPGFHRPFRADEGQLLAFQENILAGGDHLQHGVVAAGLQQLLVKGEIQPCGGFEAARAQLLMHRLYIHFQAIDVVRSQCQCRLPSGETLQGVTQLEGVACRDLFGIGPGKCRRRWRLHEHTLARLHAHQP